jgi:nucleoside-diphosphate-sugar epimerase
MEYAVGKLAAEHALLNLWARGKFELRVVRPFNAIGNWQSAGIGFVVPRFMEAALRGKPLRVHGDGKQVRAFCHVQDLVAGIEAIQRHGRDGAVYNLGNPHNQTSIGELAARIVELTSSSSAIELVDPVDVYGAQYIEAFQKIPRIDRVQEQTGWRPVIDLDTALASIHAHYVGLRPHSQVTGSPIPPAREGTVVELPVGAPI